MHFFLAATLLALFAPLATPQSIDPNSVPISTRQQWCTNQEASCPLLCPQVGGSSSPTSNTCDANSLSWTCVCSNGITPNASAFSQTVPFYECQYANQQCANNCNGDNSCVANCQNAHPCGAQSPTRINATSSASGTATATGSSGGAGSTSSGGGAAATGFVGASSSPSASAGGNLVAPRMAGVAETFGLVALLSLVAGFAFTL